MNQVVNYDERARYSAANGYQLYITQILNIQDSLEKKTKMELQQIINDKEICIDSNYFRELLITWTLYSPSGYKSSRIAK
jgi:hypothetical protein